MVEENRSGIEIDQNRIRLSGRAGKPRTMPYGDCTGVSLRTSPAATTLGTVLHYSIDLLDREGRPALHLGDTTDIFQARQAWRQAADELKVPAMMLTPDGNAANAARPGPLPSGTARIGTNGQIRVTIRRGALEYAFIAALVIGLTMILIIGEPTKHNAFFMAMAAGLLVYALIAGLSSRFIEIAGGALTAGLSTPFGNFARTAMPLAEIETVLWGRAERRLGRRRSAFVMATANKVKSFDRLTDEQARWLTRFVREAKAKSE